MKWSNKEVIICKNPVPDKKKWANIKFVIKKKRYKSYQLIFGKDSKYSNYYGFLG